MRWIGAVLREAGEDETRLAFLGGVLRDVAVGQFVRDDQLAALVEGLVPDEDDRPVASGSTGARSTRCQTVVSAKVIARSRVGTAGHVWARSPMPKAPAKYWTSGAMAPKVSAEPISPPSARPRCTTGRTAAGGEGERHEGHLTQGPGPAALCRLRRRTIDQLSRGSSGRLARFVVVRKAPPVGRYVNVRVPNVCSIRCALERKSSVQTVATGVFGQGRR